MLAIRCGEGQAELKPSPHRTVEQLGMVACCYDDHVARQLIELHEQERYDTLNFPRLMRVTPFLAECIELIEEQHTRLSAHKIEQPTQPCVRFSEIASDQRVVADDEERQGQSFGDGFRKGCLAIARRTREENAVTRLVAMRS